MESSGSRSRVTTRMHKSTPSTGQQSWRLLAEHATAAGVADRWHTIEGSAFEVEFGGNYDVVLITNFHHHFSPPTIETLMRKVPGALKPDGLAVTLEFVPTMTG